MTRAEQEEQGWLRGPVEITADGERCSHCGRRLATNGGNRHGQGIYCRTCIRTHAAGEEWSVLDHCRHCITAGVSPELLRFVA